MSEQKTQWPNHYTRADVSLIEKATQWIADRKYTQAALARLARISSSSLNQIIKGVYATSPTKLLAAVESAMRHADEASGHASSPVETSFFRMANVAFGMARRYRNFAVLSAWVGVGKTFACKHYAATHPNTYFIETDPAMTQQSLTKLLHSLIVGPGKGSNADKFSEVIESLKNTDTLIIVDEAETMTHKQLHSLRRIRDKANIGMVLAGTEYLHGLIKPQHGQFHQIRSRTGFWPETVRGITADDAAALVQSAFGAEEVADEVIARLFAYCQGSARMLCEGLIPGIKEFRRDRPLNVKLVDAVAKQALCLQSIA